MSSPLMQNLLAMAREDAPDDVARDAVWHRVAATTISAGATTAVAAPAAKIAMTKLLAIGGFIGAARTALGVVVALNVGEHESQPTPARTAMIAPAGGPATHTTSGVSSSSTNLPPTEEATIELGPEPAAKLAKTNKTTSTSSGVPGRGSDPASQLAEEARLVTEARSALLSSDPARALALVRMTHKLSVRALEPEELVLEARALRALGDADGAAATELRLRRRFPDHSAAR
jgi:hypothetical protein